MILPTILGIAAALILLNEFIIKPANYRKAARLQLEQDDDGEGADLTKPKVSTGAIVIVALLLGLSSYLFVDAFMLASLGKDERRINTVGDFERTLFCNDYRCSTSGGTLSKDGTRRGYDVDIKPMLVNRLRVVTDHDGNVNVIYVMLGGELGSDKLRMMRKFFKAIGSERHAERAMDFFLDNINNKINLNAKGGIRQAETTGIGGFNLRVYQDTKPSPLYVHLSDPCFFDNDCAE